MAGDRASGSAGHVGANDVGRLVEEYGVPSFGAPRLDLTLLIQLQLLAQEEILRRESGT